MILVTLGCSFLCDGRSRVRSLRCNFLNFLKKSLVSSLTLSPSQPPFGISRNTRYVTSRKTAVKETTLKKTLTGPGPINVWKQVLRERREKHYRIKISFPFKLSHPHFPRSLFLIVFVPRVTGSASFACCPVSKTLGIAP